MLKVTRTGCTLFSSNLHFVCVNLQTLNIQSVCVMFALVALCVCYLDFLLNVSCLEIE
jgi:hypothetical protein